MTTGAMVLAAAAAAVNPWTVRQQLIAPMMPRNQETLTSTCVYNEIVEKDVAADLAWGQVRTREAYDAKRADLRGRLIAAMGGLPERTPLNARTVATVRRDGYRIEKVFFESMPGLYVTANFFIPDGPGPFPAIVHACGHSDIGKGGAYQRPGVKGAKAGFATLVFDPIDQGERRQEPSYSSMRFPHGLRYAMGHNQIGVRAMLLGWSVSRFMVWDAMRAIDYVLSRTDVVKGDKVGYMGTSGGGTSSAFMMALDDRIGAAVPSCYLTSFRALFNAMAPQDAEQQVFGELSFGLNHAGLFVMGHVPGAVTSGHVDGFPHYGTWETYRIAADLAERLGEPGFYGQIGMPGGHGWSEGTLDAAIAWIAAHLGGKPELAPLDMGEYRFVNHLAAGAKESLDNGLSMEESTVAPGGWVGNLPGATDAFTLMKERLAAFEHARKPMDVKTLAETVRRLARIRLPGEVKVRERMVLSARFGGMTVEKHVFGYPDGLALPSVLFVPDEVKGAPAVAFADGAQIEWGRVSTAPEVDKLLAAGRPVLSIDLSGCGEIGKPKHYFYATNMTQHPEEATGVMLYTLGESLVGRRAGDILVAADWMKRRFGAKPTLHARGTVAIAAAHARAAAPDLVAAVGDVIDAPPSWAEMVNEPVRVTYFSDCVNGALEHYDWKDLLK